jgi:hypothetical protein
VLVVILIQLKAIFFDKGHPVVFISDNDFIQYSRLTQYVVLDDYIVRNHCQIKSQLTVHI